MGVGAMEDEVNNNKFNDEFITPEDIMKHLKIGRNKTYQLIHLSNFPKIKIGNTYRIPKNKYLKWLSDNMRKTIFL